VWQHQSQTVDTAPLHFARSNELVDHHLGAVGEVAELGFPDHHGVGIVGGVTVFETEHRFFRQDRIDHGERRLVFSHVLQRNISTGVPLFTLLVVNHGVTVRERATTAIFA
jgi:hypothetical protein